jgi:hypothetical protein
MERRGPPVSGRLGNCPALEAGPPAVLPGIEAALPTSGDGSGIRTRVTGFAIPRLATRPNRQSLRSASFNSLAARRFSAFRCFFQKIRSQPWRRCFAHWGAGTRMPFFFVLIRLGRAQATSSSVPPLDETRPFGKWRPRLDSNQLLRLRTAASIHSICGAAVKCERRIPKRPLQLRAWRTPPSCPASYTRSFAPRSGGSTPSGLLRTDRYRA